MKFFHLSDLHLGKRVNEYLMLEDQGRKSGWRDDCRGCVRQGGTSGRGSGFV